VFDLLTDDWVGNSMKILYAACRYQYGRKERGVDQEYESFIPALENLGHEVFHFETWDA